MRATLLTLASTLGACSHAQPLSTLPDHLGEHVEVTLHGGREVIAVLEHDGSHAVLRDLAGHIVPRDQVSTIVGRRAGRGFLEGAGFGILIGATIGVIGGFAEGDDPECGHCWFQMSAGDKAALGGLAFGALGALVGGVAGATIGSKDVFTVGSASPYRIVPSGPPGSTVGLGVTF